MRPVLLLLGWAWTASGVAIFAAPPVFYETVPGLALMGPFNNHFIRDVGLAFASSGALTAFGAWRRVRAVALAGATWPALHALFHLQIWVHRGCPLDGLFAFDVVALIAPAFLAMAVAWRGVA